jgi:putative exporter of polyketide antibiotics
VADLSPFHLYDRTTILAPGGVFDAGATIVLVGLGIVLGGLAALAFARRDLREPVLRVGHARARVVRRPLANPLLRVPALASIYEQRVSLLSWTLGVAGLALLVMSSARSSADLLTGNPTFRPYLQRSGVADPYVWLVGMFWFGVAGAVRPGRAPRPTSGRPP